MINSTAFEAIVSVSTIGAQSCYLVPIMLRITIARKTFKPGKVYTARKKDGLVTYIFIFLKDHGVWESLHILLARFLAAGCW